MKVDIQKLKAIFGEDNVLDNIANLYVYYSDTSFHIKLVDAVV